MPIELFATDEKSFRDTDFMHDWPNFLQTEQGNLELFMVVSRKFHAILLRSEFC